jgi:hypothetical protein
MTGAARSTASAASTSTAATTSPSGSSATRSWPVACASSSTRPSPSGDRLRAAGRQDRPGARRRDARSRPRGRRRPARPHRRRCAGDAPPRRPRAPAAHQPPPPARPRPRRRAGAAEDRRVDHELGDHPSSHPRSRQRRAPSSTLRLPVAPGLAAAHAHQGCPLDRGRFRGRRSRSRRTSLLDLDIAEPSEDAVPRSSGSPLGISTSNSTPASPPRRSTTTATSANCCGPTQQRHNSATGLAHVQGRDRPQRDRHRAGDLVGSSS